MGASRVTIFTVVVLTLMLCRVLCQNVGVGNKITLKTAGNKIFLPVSLLRQKARRYIVRCCGGNKCNFSLKNSNQSRNTRFKTINVTTPKVQFSTMKDVAAAVTLVQPIISSAVPLAGPSSTEVVDDQPEAQTQTPATAPVAPPAETGAPVADAATTLIPTAAIADSTTTSTTSARLTTMINNNETYSVSTSISISTNSSHSTGASTLMSMSTPNGTSMSSGASNLTSALTSTGASTLTKISMPTSIPTASANSVASASAGNVNQISVTTTTSKIAATNAVTCVKAVCSKVQNTKPAEALKAGSDFWTSGTNAGSGCDAQNVYNWCTNDGQIMPDLVKNDLFWISKKWPQTYGSDERCLALNFVASDAGLRHKSCTSGLPLICETMPDVTCPGTCIKNAALFDGNNLKDESKYGVKVKNCGKTYLFGNNPVTWEENWNTCCSVGMTPIVIETVTQMQCLSDWMKANWNYNFNYWTAGTQRGAQGDWSWCMPGKKPLKISTSFSWEGSKDLKVEECTHMRIKRDGTGLKLTGKNCASKFIFGCQSDDPISIPTTPPAWSTCAKDNTLFGSDGYLKEMHDFGKWYKAKNNQLVLVKQYVSSWIDAWKFCCKIDMRLITVASLAKIKYMAGMATDHKRDFIGDFWTSGVKHGPKKEPYWAARDLLFENAKWKAGEPSAAGDCVFYQSKNRHEDSWLTTGNCADKKKFICELKRPEGQGYAAQLECAETWGITAEQIDLLNNPNAVLPQNVKCFIKCIGEDVDMFSENGLIPLPVLRKIEQMYDNDQFKLQTAYDSYDQCSAIVKADQCATAAEQFQCGQKKDLPLTNALIADNKGSISLPTPVEVEKVPYYRKCDLFDNTPCNVNPTSVTNLQNNGKTLKGKLATVAGKKRFVSNFKIPFYDRYEAYEHCCAINMKMTMENEASNRLAIMQYLDNDRPASTSYGVVFADTYSEIESGQVVDYFCETNVKLNSDGDVLTVPLTVSCIAYRCNAKDNAAQSILPKDASVQVSTNANVGDGASTYFLCDPKV